MKKQILLAAIATLFCFAVSNAQDGGGGFPRKTPEERLKPFHEKIDSAFKLSPAQMAKVDTIFLNSFKAQQSKREELRSGGGMDREAMMAAMKKLNEERDAQLKTIFTDAQMATWKKDIEPSLRPMRGSGGNRMGGSQQ